LLWSNGNQRVIGGGKRNEHSAEGKKAKDMGPYRSCPGHQKPAKETSPTLHGLCTRLIAFEARLWGRSKRLRHWSLKKGRPGSKSRYLGF